MTPLFLGRSLKIQMTDKIRNITVTFYGDVRSIKVYYIIVVLTKIIIPIYRVFYLLNL